MYSYVHCNENTCEECKTKYLAENVDKIACPIDEYKDEVIIACPIDEYKDEVIKLTQVLENLMDTKDQITSEEFANLLFEGESNV